MGLASFSLSFSLTFSHLRPRSSSFSFWSGNRYSRGEREGERERRNFAASTRTLPHMQEGRSSALRRNTWRQNENGTFLGEGGCQEFTSCLLLFVLRMNLFRGESRSIFQLLENPRHNPSLAFRFDALCNKVEKGVYRSLLRNK